MKRTLSLLLLCPLALNAGLGQSKPQEEETTLPTQCDLRISVDVLKKDNAEKIAHAYTTYKISGNSCISSCDAGSQGAEYKVESLRLFCVNRVLKTASISYDLTTPKNILPRSKDITIGTRNTDNPASDEVRVEITASIVSSK